MTDRTTPHEHAGSPERDLEAEGVVEWERQPLDLRELRRQLSAAKARDYFEEQGRGLLLSTLVDPDGFGAWFSALPGERRVWANRYVPLAALLIEGASDDFLRLVQTYDPLQQAVVVVELAPGEDAAPEIVDLYPAEEKTGEGENDDADTHP